MTTDATKLAPLMSAMDMRNPHDVQQVLDAGGIDLKDETTGMKVLLAAARKGVPAILYLVLRRGANISARAVDCAATYEKQGQTALHVAASWGHAAIVRILLDYGLDRTLVDKEGETAEMLARGKGRLEIADFLRDYVPRTPVVLSLPITVSREYDRVSQDALLAAVEQGALCEVQRLLIAGGVELNPKGTTSVGEVPLFLAAKQGHVEVVQILIEHGADVRQADSDGWDALRSAARENQPAVVWLLLKHGAAECINNVDKWNNTALVYAARNGNGEIVEALLDHGADRHLINSCGETPELAAKAAGKSNVAEFIHYYEPRTTAARASVLRGERDAAQKSRDEALAELEEARARIRAQAEEIERLERRVQDLRNSEDE